MTEYTNRVKHLTEVMNGGTYFYFKSLVSRNIISEPWPNVMAMCLARREKHCATEDPYQ